jgi:hypothetical protein
MRTIRAYSWMVRACLLTLVRNTVVLTWISVVRREGWGQRVVARTVRAQTQTVQPCAGLWVYPKSVEEVVVAWRSSSSTTESSLEGGE